jgi:glycyl-tRNA synthetase
MSFTFYDNLGGLRFWTQDEIQTRNRIKTQIVDVVSSELLNLNQMMRITEVEAPLIMPVELMSAAYDRSDVFILMDAPGGEKDYALRAETTNGTYLIAQHLLRTTMRPPLCVYQSGLSFRRENTDGATAAKLRFNAFYQLEFQIIHTVDTKAPIAETLRNALLPVISKITGLETRLIPSDRLPSYASETVDLECLQPNGEWREIASTSRRTDFPQISGMKDMQVVELAFGLDRLVCLTRGEV